MSCRTSTRRSSGSAITSNSSHQDSPLLVTAAEVLQDARHALQALLRSNHERIVEHAVLELPPYVGPALRPRLFEEPVQHLERARRRFGSEVGERGVGGVGSHVI